MMAAESLTLHSESPEGRRWNISALQNTIGLAVGRSRSLLFSCLMCSAFQAFGLECENFDAAEGNTLPTTWTIVNTSPSALSWSSSAGPACEFLPPVNVPGAFGDFACLNRATSPTGQPVVSALCSPETDFVSSETTEVSFRLNVTPGAGSSGHVFEVLVGTEEPTPASLASYQTVFQTSDPVGAFIGDGQVLSAAIGDIQSGHVCFQYSGSDGDLVGVDNFELTANACGPEELDTDRDRVSDADDNCILRINPDQRDTNFDGFGNACDGDFNQDCSVNAIDLGLFRTQFFLIGDNDADLNGDQTVSVVDLGIFRTLFFQPPGPSGITDCQTP